MCLMVYIASDEPLSTSDWDASNLGLRATELSNREEPVRRQFSKRHAYFVGWHDYCSCGLQYGDSGDRLSDASDLAAARDSRQLLADFPTIALSHQPEIELFACWDGDQVADPEHRGRIRPLDLVRDRTFFHEKELLVVEEPVL